MLTKDEEKKLWWYFLRYRDDNWLSESGPQLARACQLIAEQQRLRKVLLKMEPKPGGELSSAYFKMADQISRLDGIIMRTLRSLRLDKQSNYRPNSAEGKNKDGLQENKVANKPGMLRVVR